MTYQWLEVARKELGVKEIEGDEDNRRILEYFGSTTLRAQADEVPWCAAFVGWVLNQCAIPGTGKALARSYLQWGEVIPSAKVGAVVILNRGNSSWQGHVGFIVETAGSYLQILGGNQNNQVCIQNYAKRKVLGYRWHQRFDTLLEKNTFK